MVCEIHQVAHHSFVFTDIALDYWCSGFCSWIDSFVGGVVGSVFVFGGERSLEVKELEEVEGGEGVK